VEPDRGSDPVEGAPAFRPHCHAGGACEPGSCAAKFVLRARRARLWPNPPAWGRLTLNILLSFAQFEREVIGERVHDKIAASKRKGIWVGGPAKAAMATTLSAVARVLRTGAAPSVRRMRRDGVRTARSAHLAPNAFFCLSAQYLSGSIKRHARTDGSRNASLALSTHSSPANGGNRGLAVPATAQTQNRKGQSQIELARVSAAVKEWVNRQRNYDRDDNDIYVGRHKTQLETIESVLMEAFDALRRYVDASDTCTEAGTFYAELLGYDEAIVGLERVWEFFRDKLDQRDRNRRERPVLRAADEVVWSCSRQVFKLLSGDTASRQGPASLKYVAPEYSPAGLQSDRPPSSLTLGTDLDFLEGFTKTLPVPLVRLPPWTVDSPWWCFHV
jgi:hypothetical protein